MQKTHFETVDVESFESSCLTLDSARSDFAQANFCLALGLDLPCCNLDGAKQKEQAYQQLIGEDVATKIAGSIAEATDEDGMLDLFEGTEECGYKLSVLDDLSFQVGSIIYREHQLRLRHYYQDILDDEEMSDSTRDTVYDLFYGETADSNKTIRHGLDEDAMKVNIALSAFASESSGKVKADELIEKIEAVVHTCAGVTDPYGELLWLSNVIKPAKLISQAKEKGFFRKLCNKVTIRS